MKNKSVKSTVILWMVFFLVLAFFATKLSIASENAVNFADFESNFYNTIKNPFDLHFAKNTAVFLWIAMIIWMISLATYFVSHGKYMHGKEHGSAEWGDVSKIEKKYRQKENVRLSENVVIGIDGKIHKRNLNVLIIGAAGTGKTRGFVFPNMLDFFGNYIITDPKGEIYKSMGGILQEQGYEVKILNTKNMKLSNRYNPLKYINIEKDKVKSEDNLRGVPKLVSILIKNTKKNKNSTSDDFWENAEILLLQSFLYYIVEALPPQEHNFNTVMKMLLQMKTDKGADDKIDGLFKELEKISPDSLGVRQYTLYKNAGEKTAQSILISLGARLAMFSDFAFKDMVSDDELNLTDFACSDKKTALFCCIPDNDQTYNFIIGMLYSQLFDVLFEIADNNDTNSLPVHCRFIMDEFANIALPQDFLNILATCRSRNISCNIILQDISQLKVSFEKGWEQIIGNCSSFVFLGGNEYGMFEYVSKLLGKTTIKTQSYQKSWSQSATTNTNIAGRELMTPDEIRLMQYEDCLVFIQNEKPIHDKKCILEKHKNYHLFKKKIPVKFIDYRQEKYNEIEKQVKATDEEILALFGKGNLTIEEQKEIKLMEQLNLHFDKSGILDLTVFGDLTDEKNISFLGDAIEKIYDFN